MPENSSSPAYLIDASIYIFQAHFSPHVECEDSDGNDLSALFGFLQFLVQFLRRTNPTVVAVAMDESLFCGFRHQLCPVYKSNRELPDENLARQLMACADACRALGLSGFGSRKYEADDIIGTLSYRLRSQRQTDLHSGVCVVSRDKDLAQLLVDTNDTLWDFSRDRRRNSAQIVSEYGIRPAQFPDYLGLVGDAVDNIGGVPGIGPVAAKALLSKYHSMEGVYENLTQVPGLSLRGAARLHKLLGEHRAQAELSKLLATIVTDANEMNETFTQVPIGDLRRRKADASALYALMNDHGFDPRLCTRLSEVAERLNQGIG